MPRQIYKLLGLLLLCVGVTTLAGCGSSDGRNMGQISGKVTANGQPPKAEIINLSFSPADGTKGTSIEVNSDGTYAGEAVVGNNRVVVTIYGDLAASGVLEKYTLDDESPLTADVTGGATTKDFEVGK